MKFPLNSDGSFRVERSDGVPRRPSRGVFLCALVGVGPFREECMGFCFVFYLNGRVAFCANFLVLVFHFLRRRESLPIPRSSSFKDIAFMCESAIGWSFSLFVLREFGLYWKNFHALVPFLRLSRQFSGLTAFKLGLNTVQNGVFLLLILIHIFGFRISCNFALLNWIETSMPLPIGLTSIQTTSTSVESSRQWIY